jgi:hypothetical protein
MNLYQEINCRQRSLEIKIYYRVNQICFLIRIGNRLIKLNNPLKHTRLQPNTSKKPAQMVPQLAIKLLTQVAQAKQALQMTRNNRDRQVLLKVQSIVLLINMDKAIK